MKTVAPDLMKQLGLASVCRAMTVLWLKEGVGENSEEAGFWFIGIFDNDKELLEAEQVAIKWIKRQNRPYYLSRCRTTLDLVAGWNSGFITIEDD